MKILKYFKSLIFSVVIISLFSQVIGVKATGNPLLLLRYRDLDEKHGELSLYLSDIPSVYAVSLPISFDKAAVKVCGSTDGKTYNNISDGTISESDLYSGSAGIRFEKNFFSNVWNGEVLYNDYYPYVSNSDGLIKITLFSMRGDEISSGENEVCKIYFEKLTNSNPNFAIASESTGYAYDEASPTGAMFLGDKTEYSVKVAYEGNVFYDKSPTSTIDKNTDFLDESGQVIKKPDSTTEKNQKTFKDVPETHWAYEYIYKLYDKKIVNGYPDGLFHPNGFVTRAEFTKMAVTAIGYDTQGKEIDFSDVSKNDWYYDYVKAAYGYEYVKGYPDSTFRPNDFITRQDLCTIIDRAFIITKTDFNYDNLFADDKDIADYSKASIYKLRDLNIVNGRENNLFLPRENATRAEVAKVIGLCAK